MGWSRVREDPHDGHALLLRHAPTCGGAGGCTRTHLQSSSLSAFLPSDFECGAYASQAHRRQRLLDDACNGAAVVRTVDADLERYGPAATRLHFDEFMLRCVVPVASLPCHPAAPSSVPASFLSLPTVPFRVSPRAPFCSFAFFCFFLRLVPS